MPLHQPSFCNALLLRHLVTKNAPKAKNETTSVFHPLHARAAAQKGFVLADLDISWMHIVCSDAKASFSWLCWANNAPRPKRPFSAKHIFNVWRECHKTVSKGCSLLWNGKFPPPLVKRGMWSSFSRVWMLFFAPDRPTTARCNFLIFTGAHILAGER